MAEYKPTEAQDAFHFSNKKYRGFKGSKGSGKTRALIEECVALCYEFPGMRGIIARKDFSDLKETTMMMFFEFCHPALIIERNRSEHFVILRSKDPNKHSRIKFSHTKDPKSFESGEIGFFALDEADEIPEETVKTLRSRLRQPGVSRYGLFAFNPPDTFHWLYKFFVKEEKPDRELFTNNTWENLDNLPPDYIESLKDTYQGDELKRFLYGDWGSISNEWAVWPMFRPSLHVSKEDLVPEKGSPIIRCHDFGMSGALTFHQFVDGQHRVLAPEVLEFGKGAEQMAPVTLSTSFNNFQGHPFLDISEPYAKNRQSADSSKTCQNIFRSHGITLKIENHSWADRMSNVNYFLSRLCPTGEPAFMIDHRNELTITGMSGAYQFEEGTHQRQASDVKDNDYTHLCDTIQMAACHYRQHAGRKSIQIPSKRTRYKFSGIPCHKVVNGKAVRTRNS